LRSGLQRRSQSGASAFWHSGSQGVAGGRKWPEKPAANAVFFLKVPS
jgi:hypothetical protein